MVRPATTDQLSRVLAVCHEARVAVVPQGGRTGLAGGAVSRPGQLIVSLERMNRIEALDPVSRTAVVEAGVTLAELEAAARPHALAVGVDLGARDAATIGGMVATNAGGLEAFRHGTMRERLLGLEAVLADGRVLTELGRVRKDNRGYALKHLLVGSEGTLAVVSRVALALVPAEAARAYALAGVPSLGAAVKLLRALERADGATLIACELMSQRHLAITANALGLERLAAAATSPWSLLVGLAAASSDRAGELLTERLAAALEAGLVEDALTPKNERELAELWRVREDWAVDRLRPGGLWYDLSVPVGAVPEYLQRLEARLLAHDPALALVVIGHLADGNLHLTVNAATPITARYTEIAALVYADLAGCGGSYSAEHGIGLEKRATFAAREGAVRLDLQRRIKAVFDPHALMNPGKVLPDD